MTSLRNGAHVPANALDLPAGLTEIDAVRIVDAFAAAHAESTRHLCALVWAQWERWCEARGIPALPGYPLALCAYRQPA
jgi:hypothetical protein